MCEPGSLGSDDDQRKPSRVYVQEATELIIICSCLEKVSVTELFGRHEFCEREAHNQQVPNPVD